MLKRILGAFFPGFSWEHGFALWDVGTAIGVGASLIGGAMGDDASEDAGAQIALANAEVQRMIKQQQGSNTRAFQPYAGIGTAASYRLSDLLGLDKPYLQSMEQIADAVEPFYASTVDRGAANLYYNPYSGQVSKSGGQSFLLLPDTKTVKANGIGEWDRQTFLDSIKGDWEKLKTTPNSSDFGSLMRNFSADDLNKDVVYNTGLQFGLDEGNKAIERRAAASGGWDSGSTLKALTRYANDYGTTKAAGAYDRFNQDKLNIYNMLSGQQGVGMNAAGNTQSLNTGLINSGISSTSNAASQQAQYGMQGAGIMNNSIMGGIGNMLYNQRAGGGYATPPYWG